MEHIVIRPIEPADNKAIATIIRTALTEFGANKPGTVFYDDTTDHLYELFTAEPQSGYFIALQDGIIVGGAGYYPTEGLPTGTCELVKMYLNAAARGMGLGRKMIDFVLAAAKQKGYNSSIFRNHARIKKSSESV
jgi:putative acetyltransferase